MKVCILTTAFPRWLGDDRGVFVLNAARALAGQGVQVRVVAIHSPGAKHREIWDGIEIIRPAYLPERWEILQKEGGGLPQVWKQNPLARLALLPFLVVQTWAAARYGRDCDLIHANWTLSGAAAWVTRLFHRRPVVVTVQGSDIYQAAKLAPARWVTRLSLSNVEAVVALSRDLAARTIALGVPDRKIKIIPNGINIEMFTPGSDDRENVILFVGSLIPRKGVHVLLDAFPTVLAACPDFRLVIIGEGPDAVQLQDQAKRLGIEGQVDFLGVQDQSQVSDWMRKARVFVLPSLEEGLGVVLLEAIASGTPCVGSQVGGIPDVVSDATGKLFPPGDAPALGRAIVEVIGNSAGWQHRSRAARQLALDVFRWERVAERLLEVYREALKGREQ